MIGNFYSRKDLAIKIAREFFKKRKYVVVVFSNGYYYVEDEPEFKKWGKLIIELKK